MNKRKKEKKEKKEGGLGGSPPHFLLEIASIEHQQSSHVNINNPTTYSANCTV
jgi:hypothetical protein